jgi:hypothetical protein
MKFLICIDSFYREELDGVANGFGTNGQQVAGFDRNIHRAFQEQNPDFLVLPEPSALIPEIDNFRKKTNPKTIILGREKIRFPDNFEMNLPGFANTMKYKPELPSKELESDIVIGFDGNNQEFVHDIYNKLHKKYRVKIIGAFINCPGYVGLGAQQDLVKLSKSSKLTICTNRIMSDSLVYNNILSVYNHPNPIELLELSKKDRDEMVLSQKKNLITENKLGQIIIEKLSNSNR